MAELRKYGVACTIYFEAIEAGTADLKAGLTFSSGDVKISKNGGALANTTNLPIEIGTGLYGVNLTAAEMQCQEAVLLIIDGSSTKAFEDNIIYLNTYGDASSLHSFDLDSPEVTVGTNNDKTGYDLTSALTTILNAIKGKTDNLPASPSATDEYNAAFGIVEGLINDVKLKTNNLPAVPAPADEYDGSFDIVVNMLGQIISSIGDLNNLSTSDVTTAIKNMTGVTLGGTWTFQKLIKVIGAYCAGSVRDKSGVSGVQEALDPEDGTTVIAEIAHSTTTPYRTIEVKI